MGILCTPGCGACSPRTPASTGDLVARGLFPAELGGRWAMGHQRAAGLAGVRRFLASSRPSPAHLVLPGPHFCWHRVNLEPRCWAAQGWPQEHPCHRHPCLPPGCLSLASEWTEAAPRVPFPVGEGTGTSHSLHSAKLCPMGLRRPERQPCGGKCHCGGSSAQGRHCSFTPAWQDPPCPLGLPQGVGSCRLCPLGRDDRASTR